MKKALKILGIAIVAAAVFAGCEQGPQDVNAEVTFKTGTSNYKFDEKTFQKVDTQYITKTVTVDYADVAVPDTTTVTKIPAYATTTTIVFGEDGVFTITETTVALAGADGDFRYYDKVTSTEETEIVYTGAARTDVVAGLAGTTTNVVSYTGTWDSFKVTDNPQDGRTLNYVVTYASKTETESNYSATLTALNPVADDGYTTDNKYTYKVVNSDVTTTTLSDVITLGYNILGTAVVGEDEVDQMWIDADVVSGTFYEVEE